MASAPSRTSSRSKPTSAASTSTTTTKKSSLAAPKTADSPASKKRARVVEPDEVEPVVAIKEKKKGKKVVEEAVVEVVAAADEIALEEDVEEEEEAEIDFLKGFESEDGEDSSDEEDAAAEDKLGLGEGGSKGKSFSISSLPRVGAETSAKIIEKKKVNKTGTVYLGRIPHGFHEEEMKAYFTQFGEVTRLRLSRNKTTGASKHYAFLEFAYASVATIVQETMDNYLLAGHILVCKIVPEAEIHPKMWIGANRVFRVVPKGRRDRVARAAPKTEEQKTAISGRLLKRENAKRAKLAKLSIDYDFKGYAGKEMKEEEAVARLEAPVVEKKKGGKKEKKVAEKKKPAEKKIVEKKVEKKGAEKVVKPKSDEPAKKKARKSM